jgi:SNF2 family DNA or RNA helicase
VADDMGLGKTLTTLSLIVSSQDHANSFAAASTGGATNIEPLPRTGATLVIVPNISRDLLRFVPQSIVLTVLVILDSWIREVAK